MCVCVCVCMRACVCARVRVCVGVLFVCRLLLSCCGGGLNGCIVRVMMLFPSMHNTIHVTETSSYRKFNQFLLSFLFNSRGFGPCSVRNCSEILQPKVFGG